MNSIFVEEYIWGLQNIGNRLGISAMEAHRRILSGSLPAQRGGHQWVARPADLDAYAATMPGDLRRKEFRHLRTATA